MNFYNDNDAKAAAWLRELIRGGHIPVGVVDERSIGDIRSDELRAFTQCHFFAGIGGWSHALKLAGWPEDRAVWTGSCPCQPFSAAGKGLAEKDPRHLWPQFRRLLSECRPSVVFGEQVASAAGRVWLAGVCDDLEGMGYAVAGSDLCAAGVGAPHIRQRLYWMAHAKHDDGRPDESGGARKDEKLMGGLVGWPSPIATEARQGFQDRSRGMKGTQESLTTQAIKFTPEREREELCGWTTPSSRDWKDTPGMSTTGINPDGSSRTRLDQLPRQAALASGALPNSSTAPIAKRGALNPAHSRWLMGFPVAWDSCGATAMQSCRSSRRNSSKPPPTLSI